MIEDAFETGQIVLMHPIQNGFFGASDVGCPSGGIGLLRGDHVESQEALAAAWMLGLHGEASQIRQGVAPGVQVGSNHRFLRFRCGDRDTFRRFYHTGAIHG